MSTKQSASPATESAPESPVVDVRTIPPRERHPLIFDTFDNLAAGESLVLVNDHEPRPLYYQFAIERPDQFTWEYLENGPEVWRAVIGKV